MEKRLVLAVALSVIIILLFQRLIPKPAVQQQAPLASAPAPVQNKEEIMPPKPSFEEKEFSAESDRYIVTFSNIGGAIKSITLKDYKKTDSPEPLQVVNIAHPKDYIFNITGTLDGENIGLEPYEVNIKDNVITCTLKTKSSEVVKKYILHKSKHSIDLQIFVKNISQTPKVLNYRIIAGSGLAETNTQSRSFLEATAKSNGKILGFRRPRPNERITTPGDISWVALKGKYFSVILKPFISSKSYSYITDKEDHLTTELTPQESTIQPAAVIENKFTLYAGPGKISILKELGYGLEDTVNYGFFGGISKVLIVVMLFFYNLVHNWGISIILLAIFLNIILFPLTAKSFNSMKKMQELHPQMENLKAKYKNEPQKLNKEIMELYKKYKINPFSGCLPLLLQMPIFIALYQALMRSIELRNARFLWIKDLSSPDAVPIPITLPLIGNSINILPLIMVVAMVVQQKISTKTMGAAVTEEQKEQQKMMLIIMPIVFGFVFYNMPSGLVLYWVMNTGLTIAEQAAIAKKA